MLNVAATTQAAIAADRVIFSLKSRSLAGSGVLLPPCYGTILNKAPKLRVSGFFFESRKG